MDSLVVKKSVMSSTSAANGEGQEKEDDEAKASDKEEETKESNKKDEETKESDKDEETKESDNKKASAKKTLQDYKLDGSNMGPNSPSGTKRFRARTSDVWASILQLKNDLAKSELCVDKTHICRHCFKLLKLYKSHSSWQTSIGLNHLANCTEYAKLGIKSEAVETSNVARHNKKQKIQSVLMQVGSPLSMDSNSTIKKSPPPVIGGFVISQFDRALASQARFYIYGQQRVSKCTFNDPAFIEMLVSSYVAGGGQAKNAPSLTVKALKLWLVEEFEIFKGYIKMTIRDMLAFTEGNPFAQCLNDACTLAHKHKCMAIGMEFVDCIHFQNHAVCLGMVPLADGTDKVGAEIIQNVLTKVTGFKYNQVMAAMISDLAAKGIAREFNQVSEWCDMHQGDKIGRAAVGDLVRSKNKVPVNPFPAGQVLMKKCHAMAVYFSYGKRHGDLLKFTSNVPGGLAQIKLKVDLNDTRVSARHSLLYSEIRLNKALKLYAIAHEQPWQLTAAQWQALTEVEAVLAISKELTVFVQNEMAFTAAIGRPFKENMLTKLRSDTLSVVDLEQVTESPNLIRHDVPLEDMTEIGRTSKWHATLEAEHRYCGNTGEDHNNERVDKTDRDKLAVMLDPRTLISLSKSGVMKVERGLLLLVLKEEYIKGLVMKKLIKQDPDKKYFGHLPMMAVASRGSIGGFLASSFCERINSCANLVLMDGNSLLSPDEINMLVTLRMNRKFMKFMREHHVKDGQHKRLLSEIRPA